MIDFQRWGLRVDGRGGVSSTFPAQIKNAVRCAMTSKDINPKIDQGNPENTFESLGDILDRIISRLEKTVQDD